MKKGAWKVLLVCLLLSYAVAAIGSVFTMPGGNSSWYQLVRPSITPPDYVFGIVWNVLFFLIAVSLFFAWTSAKTREDKKRVVKVYAINFVANIFWSVLYFSLHQPLWAFIDLVVLGLSIVSIMLATWDEDRKVTWLLVPYLLWICFAGVLNWMSL